MAPIDRERLALLFAEALELPERERRAFALRACGDDDALLEELLSLIEHDLAGVDDETEGLAAPMLRLAQARFVGQEPNQEGESEAAAAELELPERVGAFRIKGLLGRGGMGEVYLAEQSEPFRRDVALKILRPGLDTREVLRRFETERQALARMSHPNVARAYDAGVTEEGRPYFLMEPIEGKPITRFADEERLDVRARLVLFLQVCDGIEHAHRKGLIHRDLKPSNVLVTREQGRALAKIIDFGIAKSLATDDDETLLTRAGVLLGTPAYMSPEQASSGERDVDTRSDVYALGVLLYELLTGALPFESEESSGQPLSSDALRARILNEDPRTPSSRVTSLGAEGRARAAQRGVSSPGELRRRLRGELDWIVGCCLEKDPERRYASARDLAEDIRRHLDQRPVEAGPPSLGYRAAKMLRRHRTAATIALLLALVVFVVIGGLARVAAVERRERAAAEAEARKAERLLSLFTGIFNTRDVGEEGQSPRLIDVLARADEKLRQDVFADEPITKARLLRALGMSYSLAQEYESAVGVYARASAVIEELLAAQPGPRVREQALRELGGLGYEEAAVLYFAGRLNDAEERIEAVLASGAVAGEEAALERASALNLLGLLKRRLGDLDEAERHLNEALRLHEEHAGLFDFEEHREKIALGLSSSTPEEHAATVSENLAQILAMRGDFAGAEERVRHKLEFSRRMAEREGREVDPGVATSIFNLAWLLVRQGRHEEAAAHFAESARMERALGRRADMANARAWEAGQLDALGREEEAVEALRESIALTVEVFGEEQLADTRRTDLARKLANAGRYEEALTLAATLEESALAAEPPRVMSAMRAALARAAALAALDREEDAMRAYDEACARAKAAETGALNPSPFIERAAFLIGAGDPKRAEAALAELEEVVETLRVKRPSERALRALRVRLALARGEAEEALRLAESLEAFDRERAGTQLAERAEAGWLLAAARLAAGRLEEARALVSARLEEASQELGTAHPVLAEGWLVSAESAEAAGEPSIAREHATRALTILARYEHRHAREKARARRLGAVVAEPDARGAP